MFRCICNMHIQKILIVQFFIKTYISERNGTCNSKYETSGHHAGCIIIIDSM